MRKLATTVGATAMIVGSLLGTPTAGAAQVSTLPPAPVPVPTPQVPKVQLLDCYGSTGWMGCGPGWTWRDGWRGFACYPC
jgi:hypothetical protein